MNALFDELIESELLHRLGWTLLHSIWILALVGVLIIAVMILFRKQSAQTRYAVAYLGLLLMAMAPFGVFAISPAEDGLRSKAAVPNASIEERWGERSAVPHPLPPKTVSPPTDAEAPFAATASDPTVAGAAPLAAGSESSSLNWSMAAPWTGLSWLVGIVILSIWRGGGWWTAQRMRSVGSASVPGHVTATVGPLQKLLGVSRPVRILQSSLVEVPVVFGWLKPTILLPFHVLESLTGAQLRMVLAHELAHIRRHDYLANLVQTCIETLLFFHPAVWWISRRIRAEREHCCDDLAVRYCGDGADLASALVAVEEGRCEPLPAPALAATGGDTDMRVRRLLGISNRRERVGISPISMLLGVSLLAVIGIAIADPVVMNEEAGKDEKAVTAHAAEAYETLYDVLMTRYGPDGKPYAQNESTPVILPETDFPFGDKTYTKFNDALKVFMALPQEEIEAYSDIQRAILQRHLWKVYDASHPEYWTNSAGEQGTTIRSYSERRASVGPKIATLVGRLALSRDQILALPNTLIATIQSGGAAKQYDPNDRFKPFLPADLGSKESAWVCLGDESKRGFGLGRHSGGFFIPDAPALPIPADVHSTKFKWRSAFVSFMRAPGGRADTLECIEKFNREEELPVGTQFALIEQAFLISDEGELVLSPLIFSVSLRAYASVKKSERTGDPVTTQCVAEFVLEPRELIRGNTTLKALSLLDTRYEIGEVHCVTGGIQDPFESWNGRMRPRLKQCSSCHETSGTPAEMIGFHTARPGSLKEGNLDAIREATSVRKQADMTWQALSELLQSDAAQ